MKDKLAFKIAVLGLFALLVTTLVVVKTYALFETNGNANKELSIAAWTITLNDVDVTESRTITLNDFTYVNGTHTQANYFAPGSQAYFDLVIDATAAQVSVQYTLTIDDTEISEYPNIYFTITDVATNTQINNSEYTGVIPLNSQDRTRTLRINLVWDNASQYDASDTSLIGETLAFAVNANFKQYVGE